jgi:hypothetical protein
MDPTPPPIMSWSEYASRRNVWPYVLDLPAKDGALLYYGALHAYMADEEQKRRLVEDILARWNDFHPALALNEGGDPPVAATIEEAVGLYGEAGLVRYLASRDDIPVASLDPTKAEEVAFLRREFAAPRIKLCFVLRAAAQFAARSKHGDVGREVDRVLEVYDSVPGLRGRPRRRVEVTEALVEERLPVTELSRIPLRWFDPLASDTICNLISRTSSEYRDEWIVARLASAVSHGERVFAVVGGTHVVMQERRLRWELAASARLGTSEEATERSFETTASSDLPR